MASISNQESIKNAVYESKRKGYKIMGHMRLWGLPKTRRWREVIDLIDAGEDVSDVALASLHAADSGLSKVASDPGLVQALYELFRLSEAASSKDTLSQLTKIGYQISTETSPFDLISQLRERIEAGTRHFEDISDVGEIALNALTETIGKSFRSSGEDLFGGESESTISTLKKFTTGKNFQLLMHEFYASFTHRYLSYYLSRELPQHIGVGRRFDNLSEEQDFEKAFNLYVRQSIHIVDEFTPGWFGKARFEDTITSEHVRKYAHVAFKKIRSEFTRGGGLDQ